ncbi:MAG: 50S ribosomal protein L18Ae [Candidatus Thermoplasmatota archaeon]|nr:50S ribosomal protein L18Ae [Candidatus Thermoplasmatota archaeon]
MKAYRVEGQFRKKKRKHTFTKEILGENEEQVREKILSIVGSNHRVKRSDISIAAVTEISPEDVQNPVVKYQLEE